MSRLPVHAVLLALLAGRACAIVYTGDVAADFGSSTYMEDLDGTGDVGLPLNAPPATVSGWDVERFLVLVDFAADELQAGIEFAGIGGDADGDGFEGLTSPWLAANGGLDLPGLAMTESICVAFDFDQDGVYDLVAGTPADGDGHRVAAFEGSSLLPAFAFGADLPAHAGPAFHAPPMPDYEFTLTDLSTLDDFQSNGLFCIDYRLFAGSFQDDGIGEDLMTGTFCLDCCADATDRPAAFALGAPAPNPFNPSTVLRWSQVRTGPARLEVFDLLGRSVACLVDGLQAAGAHEARFDGGGLPSGVYLARLATEDGAAVQRLLLLK